MANHYDEDSKKKFVNFLDGLLDIKKEAMSSFRKRADSGVTSEQLQAAYDYIDVLEGVLTRYAITPERLQESYNYIEDLKGVLISFGDFFDNLPEGYKSWEVYFSDIIQRLFAFNRFIYETAFQGGTIVGPLTCGSVISRLEDIIAKFVYALCCKFGLDKEYDQWIELWRNL